MQEPWIQGLLAVQVVIFLAAVLSRNRIWISGPIFFLSGKDCLQ